MRIRIIANIVFIVLYLYITYGYEVPWYARVIVVIILLWYNNLVSAVIRELKDSGDI